MLNESELKEINKLSPELRDKIVNIFTSPVFIAWEAARSQLNAICKELRDTPKLIDANLDYEKFKDIPNGDKIILALEAASRGKSETALKWNKELKDLVSLERSLFDMLNPEEQRKASTILTMSDVRKEALG